MKRKRVPLWERLAVIPTRRKSKKLEPASVELRGGGPGDGAIVEAVGRSIAWVDDADFVHGYAYDLSSLHENQLLADYVGVIGRRISDPDE